MPEQTTIITTGDAMRTAEETIRDLISQGILNVVPLMKAVSAHVNTMDTATRMALRAFIVANGGDLTPPKPNTAVVDFSRGQVGEGSTQAKRFSEPDISGLCSWPVERFDPLSPSDSKCCGKAVMLNPPTVLEKPYCAEHAKLATERVPAARNVPLIFPSASRINQHHRKSKGKAMPRSD